MKCNITTSIDTLLLLAQTTHHGVLGVGLYASFCKIPHLGQFLRVGLYATSAYMRVYTVVFRQRKIGAPKKHRGFTVRCPSGGLRGAYLLI